MPKKLLNKETVLYLFFGGFTTLVNYLCFYLFYRTAGLSSLWSNFIAFAAAVIFAYLVNKLFVFESKSWSLQILLPEMGQFLAARIFSFLLEEAGLWVADDLLKLGRFTLLRLGGFSMDGILLTKLALAVVVVVLNYVFCKLLIFKKK